MSYFQETTNQAATVQQGHRLNKVYGNNGSSLELTKVGGIGKSAHMIGIAGQRANVESQMMAISFKANRTQEKRDKRANFKK